MEGALLALLLACPVGMGLMMWFMNRGMKKDRQANGERPASGVDELRGEHTKLGAEIERREREDSKAAGE